MKKTFGRAAMLAMLLMVGALSAMGQSVKVSGHVTAVADGEALIGVSVVQRGTSTGTVTNANGDYEISVPVGTDLEFSYIGYASQTVKVVSGRNVYDVALVDDANVIDELVVVGYGVQKKSVMSSSVSRVTADDLDLGHPTNVQNAMKGKVSGVIITQNSGQPGADSKIRIRGVGTVNNSDPLYIIDGMPSESGINHLNPSDIESIEILKDAASAAIYGARGANGVVLVTTKQGKAGKTSVTYEFSYGFQNPSHKLDLVSSEDYQMLINEMGVNSGRGANFYFPTKSNVNTDWQKEIQNDNAPVVNHRLSISGGTDRDEYYLSLGYLKQEGIYGKGYSDYERLNVRLNNNLTLMDVKNRNWLNKLVLNTNTSFSSQNTKGGQFGNSEVAGILTSINMLPPTEPVYQTDAAKIAEYEVAYPNAVKTTDGRYYNIVDMREIVNPLADLIVNHNERTNPKNFNFNFGATLDVLPGLKYKSTLAVEYVMNSWRKVTPVYELNSSSKNSQSTVQQQKTTSTYWQWENILTYNKSFGKHNVGALVGTTMSDYYYEGIGGQDYDLLVTDINKGYIDIAGAPETDSSIWGNASDHKMASVFGRLNYNYDEKYLLEFVIRRDGSSNFSRDHQYATFPSVSAGWVITNEKFMEHRPAWFEFAKIRASWGQNGNENIGSFRYTSMMGKGKDAVWGGDIHTGMLPTGYANKDLKWETSEQTDLGLDLRFLKNALTFTVDYYVKKTKDMLLWKPIPLYTSFSSMLVNAGTVKNTGVEFEASYRFNVGKVHLGVQGNASWLKNEVTDQGPDRMGIDGITGGMGGQVTYSENGRPYGFFFGYVTDGVFQNQAQVDASGQAGAQPGDLRFKDLDGNGTIDANDRTMIGNPIPDWTFGLTLNAEWNGFDASIFFQGTAGNDIYKLYRRSNVALATFESSWLDRWHGEGTSNTNFRIVEGDNNNYQISDWFVQDGSYLRLKVAQLGYTLPRQLVNNIGIQNLRVYIQGENLLTFTGYDGYDPEVGTRNGLDSGTYPSARTITLGASVTF